MSTPSPEVVNVRRDEHDHNDHHHTGRNVFFSVLAVAAVAVVGFAAYWIWTTPDSISQIRTEIAKSNEVTSARFAELADQLKANRNQQIIIDQPAPNSTVTPQPNQAPARTTNQVQPSADVNQPATPAPAAKPAQRVQQNTPAPDSDEYKRIAAQAYGSLGPAPGGAQVKNFQITEPGFKQFTCPDGSAGKEVNSVDKEGMTFKRWACPKATRVRN